VKRPLKLVFACGGTGGHIFPAISVAEELRRRDPATRIVYVCGKKDIESAIFKVVSGEAVESIDSAPYRGKKFLADPRFAGRVLAGFRQARTLLRRERPDAVVGFGGYVSFPAVLMARLSGIPALLHEQNVVPGMANRLLSRAADGTALSFEETRALLPGRRNLRWTGNPIRRAIERDCRAEALAFLGFSPSRATMLVLGGSQGAESINTQLAASLPLLDAATRSLLQVLHLCGRMDPAAAEATGRRAGVPLRAFSFFERMDLAYGAADFVLGRAGATFLAEVAAKGLPAILVPYPYGNGHQRQNARAFAAAARATVVEQAELKPERLAGLIREYREAVANSPRRDTLVAAAATDARSRLADFIEETARRT
jgi:UDP-N-acetylglucosamine--N-acetylmuramyl-(pentapeptide) pyrophosphoryl-undecaprenol N-acetylglucosamine transferase